MNDISANKIIGSYRRGWAVAFAGLGVNLALGVLYSWGVFASALREAGWTAIQSQIPYMIACAVFAVLMVPGGLIQDHLGPKLVLLIAAILTGLGFVFSGLFMTVAGLSLSFGVIFGTAMGFGYSTTTPAALKWFSPHRRGLISGIVVSGFGLAGIYIAPLTHYLIDQTGLSRTYIILGVVFCLAIFIFRLVIKNPPENYIPPEHHPLKGKKITEPQNAITSYNWRDMIKTRQFYLLWVMFLFGTFAGLLILGQLSNIGQEQIGLSPNEATVFIVIYAVLESDERQL
jgi:OFA family oxalate/formate antiporter-like MFS transporter